MEIKVPYGQETVDVEIERERVLGVVHPNAVDGGDPRSTIMNALDAPLASPSFGDFLEGGGDVLFIVNDGTRPTPTAQVLEILEPLIAGVDASFLVATGVHRAPTRDEYRFIFGDLYDKYAGRIHAHDARRTADMVHLGESSSGTPMEVNRRGVEASRIVVIGSVEPHYFGGYTGGRKSFLPGIASYRTIEHNHRHAVRPEPRALLLEGNPVHEDGARTSSASRPCWTASAASPQPPQATSTSRSTRPSPRPTRSSAWRSPARRTWWSAWPPTPWTWTSTSRRRPSTTASWRSRPTAS
jgi:nickel-dependent lactate racemase